LRAALVGLFLRQYLPLFSAAERGMKVESMINFTFCNDDVLDDGAEECIDWMNASTRFEFKMSITSCTAFCIALLLDDE